jgi:hypothetical protein
MKKRPRSLIRGKVNERLIRAREEDKATDSEYGSALDAYMLEHQLDWLKGPMLDADVLEPRIAGELEDASVAIFQAILTIREHDRWRRGRGHGTELFGVGYSPDWWELGLEQLFGRLRPLQREALRLIGRGPDEFLAVGAVSTSLPTVDALKPDAQLAELDVPIGYEHGTPLLTYRTMDLYDAPAPLDRLRQLRALAARVEVATKCTQFEAIAFLLSGVVPWVPAVAVATDMNLKTIVIEVRDPRVAVDVVADAYKQARKDVPVGSIELQRGARRPDLVFEFAIELSHEHGGRFDWKAIHNEFSEFYPHVRYTAGALRQTFYRERDKREGSG